MADQSWAALLAQMEAALAREEDESLESSLGNLPHALAQRAALEFASRVAREFDVPDPPPPAAAAGGGGGGATAEVAATWEQILAKGDRIVRDRQLGRTREDAERVAHKMLRFVETNWPQGGPAEGLYADVARRRFWAARGPPGGADVGAAGRR